MRNLIRSISVAVVLAATPDVKASVTIGHVENTSVGQFLDSGGSLTGGGVSVGFFSSAPPDSFFGTTISDWATLLGAGYTDVRAVSGATPGGGFDWDFPSPVGGSVLDIPIASLQQNTQLYLVAFNAGTFNTGTPANSFLGATKWAVVKDDANLSPADLGTKTILLNTVTTASEVLMGADNGINVNLAPIVPEPSSMLLLGVGSLGIFLRRRRG